MLQKTKLPLLLLWLMPLIGPLAGYAQPSAEIEDWLAASATLYRTDPDSALRLARWAYRQSLVDNREGLLARSLDQIGQAQERTRQLDSARYHFGLAFEVYHGLGDSLGMARVKLHQGGLERREDLYDRALECYFEGLHYAEPLPVSQELGLLHNGIGLSFRRLEKFERAETHFQQALEIRRQIKDEKGLADTYSSLANLYGTQASISQNRKEPDSLIQPKLEAALRANRQAFELYEKVADTISLMRVVNNMGNIYLSQKRYEEAELLYRRAIEFLKNAHNPERLVSAYNNLATLYSRLGDHARAIATYERAYATLGDRPAWDLRRLILFNLSTEHQKAGQYEEAIQYLKDHLPYRDSTYNADALARAEVLEKEYEISKGKQQLAENEKTIALQQNQMLRLGLVAVLLFFLLGGAVLFFQIRNRHRRRAHQWEMDQLLRKQENLLLDAMLEGQEKAQHNFAKELHDNIGMMLSTVNLHFSRLEDKLDRQDETLEKAKTTLVKTVREVRKLSHNLLAGTLQHLGLVPALEELKQEMEKTGFLDFHLNVHGMEAVQLPHSMTHSLYRIIQELLTNTIRHAQAGSIQLQLTRRDGMLNVVFQDDGIGIAAGSNVNSPGIGLRNIKARMEALKGKMHVNSFSGKGTTVILEVPLVDATREWLPQ